jgi:hypothetical protein
MKKQEEKNKIVMKLANQYAESYKLLELENTTLRKELEDTIQNLTLNKNLINSLTSNMKLNYKDSNALEVYKKEIASLNSIISHHKNENIELKKIINSNNLNIEPILTKSQKGIDNLQNKVFLLENSIIKKDNIIRSLNSKLDELVYNKYMGDNERIQEIAVSSV